MGYQATRSPENFEKQTPDFKSDVYSLGSMFFQILTGKTQILK
jgi:serine/threonine protein kinase